MEKGLGWYNGHLNDDDGAEQSRAALSVGKLKLRKANASEALECLASSEHKEECNACEYIRRCRLRQRKRGFRVFVFCVFQLIIKIYYYML